MAQPKISPIILGSTGMVGKGVLLECLKNEAVEKVLVVNRYPVGITHAKLKEIILKDLKDVASISKEFTGYDTCFYTIGISAAGLSEEQYAKVNYNMVIDFSKELRRVNPNVTFIYVSGKGTDSSEKGKIMWARVKGKTENALLGMGFKAAYMFRPGLIQPLDGIKSRTKWYNVFYTFFRPLYFIFKHFRNYVTDTTAMGKAMIRVARQGYSTRIVESGDINVLAEKA